MMVLQLLKRQPMHGYAIAQTIRNASTELLQVEEGSLYPALQRLLKDGWVTAHWDVSATNRRVRVYTLTLAGARQLEREIRTFKTMLEGIRLVLAPAKL